MTTFCTESENQLLATVPEAVLDAWMPQVESVEVALGQVLYEGGSPQRHVYFPTTAIVCPLLVLHNGDTAAMAVIGREGMVGMSVFFGVWSMPSRAVVQRAGLCFRLPAAGAQRAFEKSLELRYLLLRHTQALMTQISQNAVCNRHHTVKQQLCRWLLLSLDRAQGEDLELTHELIAQILGVRREGVSEAASRLQDSGIIRYSRGHITVLDRTALEGRACECYRVVKAEYDRLLPHVERASSDRCWPTSLKVAAARQGFPGRRVMSKAVAAVRHRPVVRLEKFAYLKHSFVEGGPIADDKPIFLHEQLEDVWRRIRGDSEPVV